MAIVTKKSRPLAIRVFSATPFESTLLEETIKERISKTKIRLVVADRAYNSDPLDQRLKGKGIELIAPHKRNRKRKRHKMAESYATTPNAGPWSAFSPGCTTLDDVLLDTKEKLKTSRPSSTSPPF